MLIAVLHAALADNASADEADALAQAAAVTDALKALGHEPVRVTMTLDLARAAAELTRLKPDAVFNLVESLEGSGRLIHLAPALLDHIKIPYTGADTAAMFLTTDKVVTKERLASAGINTPAWLLKAGTPPAFPGPYMIKPVAEDASVGLDDSAVVPDGSRLGEILADRQKRFGPCFVEQFIDGREFNISILDGPGGAEVLPPAEIVFSDFPDGKPRIVGYEAKWDQGGFEYTHTERTFDFPRSDRILLDRLKAMTLACWDLFRLKGYGRVDFRVDTTGAPFVLEVNANPCIAPDAGFPAAAGCAGLAMTDIVGRIVQNALTPARTTD